MSELKKERTRVLIEICTRSLFIMMGAAANGNTQDLENGRKSLEEALCKLAEVDEVVERVG